MIRVGLVDFDTSHVVAFTQRLNHVDIDSAQWVNGARIVAGCPGDSDMMPERIPGYTEQLRRYGIQLVARPEDLIGQIDAVMITSQQGRRHLGRVKPFLQNRIPAFVDKPFAGSVRDAEEMISLARKHRTPLMSCSALRYAPEVREALRLREYMGRIHSADVWGTASLHKGNPGLLQYGIHGVEMLFTLMGRGCKTVRALTSPGSDMTVGAWAGGRFGTLRGIREGEGGFGFTAHYERGHHAGLVKGSDYYREMLRDVIELFARGKEPIDLDETRDIIAFIEAAAASSARDGRAMSLKS